MGVTRGATDGSGAANQLCSVGNAHLREPGVGADDREILLDISSRSGAANETDPISNDNRGRDQPRRSA